MVINFESHTDWELRLKYFTDVTNAEELGEMIVAGKIPTKTSLVNSKLVPGLLPLYAAGDKTLRSLKDPAKGLSTRTMGSELVFNLSGSRHIRESLKRFGVKSKECKEVLLAWFVQKTKAGTSATATENKEEEEDGDISNLIKGKETEVSEMEKRASREDILKFYKLKDEELAVSSLVDCVVFRIGAKDFL